MDQLISYLGDPQLKAAFLEQITIHEQHDQFVKGTYGEMNGKFTACAIGCSLRSLNIIQGKANPNSHTGDHDRYPTELGLPLWLAYLEDHLFETLSEEESQAWPRQFAEAIPVGVTIPDRTLVKILRWTLAADTFGVRHATDDPEVVAIIDHMAALFDRELAGDSPSDAEWNEAAWAAWAAWAARAARAARAAWAAWAARAARAARAAWDAWAAWDARDAWAAWDARDAWDAWDARAAWDAWDEPLHNGAKAAAFSTALSRYVLDELRSLAPSGVEAVPV